MKRNPNDLTLRNLKAGKKVDNKQLLKLKELEKRIRKLEIFLAALKNLFKKET